MNRRAVIETRDLRVSYGTQVVLDQVNLVVLEGEFVSIVGKSGCGKSTLLLALAGFIARDGYVGAPEQIGVVFQNYAAFPWLTVRGNIAFGLSHLDESARSSVIDRHLELIELTEHQHKFPAQLSGGQNQRVALARALAPNPSIVFMDEPFGALDLFTRDRMQEWLEDIRAKQRNTILFVTHNIEEAIFLSDRVVLIGEGGILDEVQVTLPRPRTVKLKYEPAFVDLKRRIVEKMWA